MKGKDLMLLLWFTVVFFIAATVLDWSGGTWLGIAAILAVVIAAAIVGVSLSKKRDT